MTTSDSKHSVNVLDYKGTLWVASSTHQQYTTDELWFIVRSTDGVQHEDESDAYTIPYLSHIWKAKKQFGCTYPQHIEDQVKRYEKYLHIRSLAMDQLTDY